MRAVSLSQFICFGAGGDDNEGGQEEQEEDKVEGLPRFWSGTGQAKWTGTLEYHSRW